jgi:hypothetical protein
METEKSIVFGRIEIPIGQGAARLTTLHYKEISKYFNLRMYPTQENSDEPIEQSSGIFSCERNTLLPKST